MKKKTVIFGSACMIIGAVLYLMKWESFEFLAGQTTIKLYPATFFFLAGIIIFAQYLTRKNAAK